jgi:aconitate hydratase
MGILPLQFSAGESADSHGLDGSETFSIVREGDYAVGQTVTVNTSTGKTF